MKKGSWEHQPDDYEALESRCQYAEAALDVLKEKVRRYLGLVDSPFADEVLERRFLRDEIRELVK